MATYKQLIVWQDAMSLMKEVYALTKDSVKKIQTEDEYCIIHEIRLCADNIPSSIALGAEKRTNERFLSYLKIANSASIELDTKLRIAKDIGEIATRNIRDILIKIEKLQKLLILLRRPIELAVEKRNIRRRR